MGEDCNERPRARGTRVRWSHSSFCSSVTATGAVAERERDIADNVQGGRWVQSFVRGAVSVTKLKI